MKELLWDSKYNLGRLHLGTDQSSVALLRTC